MKRLEHGLVLARTEDKALLILPENAHSKIGWELSLKLRLPQFKVNSEKGWLEADLEELVPAAEVLQAKFPSLPSMTKGARLYLLGIGFPLPDTVNTF